MVLAGAGRHRAKELVIPANLRLASLPARSPELNPAEHLWEELREKWLGNQLFPHQQAVERRVEKGLAALAGNPQQVASLAGFHWIPKIPLTAI
jgi:putative transposase